jgi:hypothetical protein
VDPSALIFVALAVAWAVYLVPKALQHHDDAVRSRSVDRFSHTMRVLARREPVSRRNARLVVTPGRPASAAVVVTKGGEPTPVEARTRRATANVAARRRRRVLGVVLLANVVVAALAGFAEIGWVWTAVPAGLLVAWLVACRLMVRRERSGGASVALPDQSPAATSAEAPVDAEAPAEYAATTEAAHVADLADTSSMAAVVVDPMLWDPVPVTLPTYVTKPAAQRRTVRTIDLDATGVWTSGNTAGDSQLARDAEQADKAARSRKADDDQRAVGS